MLSLSGAWASCLDGVDRVVRSIEVQEVAVQELGQMSQLRLFRKLPGVFELIGIAVYADGTGSGVTAISNNGPATPQPRSAATIPGLSSSLSAE